MYKYLYTFLTHTYGVIGKSKWIQKIHEQISQVAYSTSNVLIYGETGTGKELIAQAIHNLSSSSQKKFPFWVSNCISLSFYI